MKPSAVVITVSDRSARGERDDLSGPEVAALLEQMGIDVVERRIVPDETVAIVEALRAAVAGPAVLAVTTGGTGLSPRDVTPEATRMVIEREVPGLAEAMRAASLATTAFAMLSRAVCGTAGTTLIINLPGSPRGARECLQIVAPILPHALDVLAGGGDREHDQRLS